MLYESPEIAAQREERCPVDRSTSIMRAEETVEDRAKNDPQPEAPRASAGLRCRTGVRAGETKKEAYLIVKMETVIISG